MELWLDLGKQIVFDLIWGSFHLSLFHSTEIFNQIKLKSNMSAALDDPFTVAQP